MKTRKESKLRFSKKSLTELQGSDNVSIEGGRDTQYRDYQKLIDTFKKLNSK